MYILSYAHLDFTFKSCFVIVFFLIYPSIEAVKSKVKIID